eukprot:EG_transcript_26095
MPLQYPTAPTYVNGTWTQGGFQPSSQPSFPQALISADPQPPAGVPSSPNVALLMHHPFLPPFPPPQRNTELYQNLMLTPEASEAELEWAFKALAMQFHPDRKPADGGAMFRKVSQAKGILLDPPLKAQYDRFRKEDKAITAQWCAAAAALTGHSATDLEKAVWEFHLPAIRQTFEGPLLPAPGAVPNWPPALSPKKAAPPAPPAPPVSTPSSLEDIDEADPVAPAGP